MNDKSEYGNWRSMDSAHTLLKQMWTSVLVYLTFLLFLLSFCIAGTIKCVQYIWQGSILYYGVSHLCLLNFATSPEWQPQPSHFKQSSKLPPSKFSTQNVMHWVSLTDRSKWHWLYQTAFFPAGRIDTKASRWTLHWLKRLLPTHSLMSYKVNTLNYLVPIM